MFKKKLTIFFVASKEEIQSFESWSAVKVSTLGDQDFFDTLGIVDNNTPRTTKSDLEDVSENGGQLSESRVWNLSKYQVSQQVLDRNLAKKSLNVTKSEKTRESLFTF